MTWHRQPCLALDSETTGPDPDTARLVTVTIIETGAARPRVMEWLIAPSIPIPPAASAIHGITEERAREDGTDPETAVFEVMAELGLWLGRGLPVIAFNAAFDLTVLDRECRRLGIDTLSSRLHQVAPVIDPFVVDKHVDKYRRGSRKLVDVCAHYGIDLSAAHSSTADAQAAGRLAFALAERFPALQVTPESLHDMQTGWRFEQSQSLQAHFRKTDPTAVVNGDWPIHQLPDGWTPQLIDEPEEIPA